MGSANVKPNQELYFANLCKTGNLEKVKISYDMLTKTQKNKINFDKIFCDTCKRGHLEIAKWLYGIVFCELNKMINISANNDTAFVVAFYSQYYHITKFLLEINPNIQFHKRVSKILEKEENKILLEKNGKHSEAIPIDF